MDFKKQPKYRKANGYSETGMPPGNELNGLLGGKSHEWDSAGSRYG